MLEDAPPLVPEEIRQLGLLIADRRAGAFRLEIAVIAPLEDDAPVDEPETQAPASEIDGRPGTPQAAPPSEHRLRLVYDGDCPMCRRYVRWQRIRRDVGELELIDGRRESEARRELSARGIDLDQGFALQVGYRWYHGGEALHRLALLGTRSGVFNRLMYRLFASPRHAARLYPWLRACRNGLLRLMGVAPIGNLHGKRPQRRGQE